MEVVTTILANLQIFVPKEGWYSDSSLIRVGSVVRVKCSGDGIYTVATINDNVAGLQPLCNGSVDDSSKGMQVLAKLTLRELLHSRAAFFKAAYGQKLTLANLGKLVGKNKSTISQWLSEDSPNVPTLQSFKRLCMILQVDPNILLNTVTKSIS